jgi:phage gp29-like protein
MATQKPVTIEIATPESDIYMDYIGRTLLNPDKLLRTEGSYKGIELYEETLTDPQVTSTLQTRKLAVICKEWEVIPASDKLKDRKIAEFVEDVLYAFNHDAARRALLTGIVLGYKPAEVMWDVSEGSVWIKEIIGRPARRFVFDLDRNIRLLTISNMIEGETVPDRKFVVFRNTSDNGTPYGDPLGRSLYWPTWFKKNAIKFWMIFSDKFGMPTVMGKYPPGTDGADVQKLLDAAASIQKDTAIAIPDNMLVELVEATRSGSMNTYESLCNFMNAEISKVMLGQTLTTEMSSKGGSYAAAQTHNDVRADYAKADADALCECFNNSLIKWIVDYNYPGVTQYPKVWIRTLPESDLLTQAQRDKILAVDIQGLPIPASYFYETYHIPEPKGDEAVILNTGNATPGMTPPMSVPVHDSPSKSVSTPAQEDEPTSDQSFAEPGAGLFPDQTAIDNIKMPVMPIDPAIRPLLDLINAGQSYAEIEDHLFEKYPDMKTDQIEKLLERAIFVAEVWGRLNA